MGEETWQEERGGEFLEYGHDRGHLARVAEGKKGFSRNIGRNIGVGLP